MPGGGATRPPDLRSHQLLRGAPASPSPQTYPGGEPRLRRRAASPGDRGARDRARGPLVGRTPMNILLLSMPDSFEHMPSVAIRMPNGALTSLAGNVDPHHRVAVADLILVQRRVRETLERLVREVQPDVIGLSIMTFQRHTALRIIQLVRRLRPAARVVVGGYDASLASEAYTDQDAGVDFIVRGEGELTFRELVRALERGTDLSRVAGLSFRSATASRTTPIVRSPISTTGTCACRTGARGSSRATRWSAGRSTSWKRRAGARSIAASARSSRCAGAISTRTTSTACSPTFATPAPTAPRRSSSSTTTSR